MIVDPVHPVPVVKKPRDSTGLIRQEPMKSSVQACRKHRILFIKAKQIGRPLGLYSGSMHLQTASSRGIRVVLSGKNQNGVSSPVVQRHSVRERVPPRSPA